MNSKHPLHPHPQSAPQRAGTKASAFLAASAGAKYRSHLPQLDSGLFLTDGGLETTLIFHDGVDLPHFASFPLLQSVKGQAMLRRYYERYLRIALEARTGFVLESPTWRANPDWGQKLGYSPADLDAINKHAILFLADLRDRFESSASPMVISGNLGPRGDGYVAAERSADEAAEYHAPQVRAFAEAGADLVTVMTMNHVAEAIGVTRAAAQSAMPVVVGFTVETDGRLPSGQPLGEAIQQLDSETNAYASYVMLNCAHPTHFPDVIGAGSEWLLRLRGVRANASKLSHEELDNCVELDSGDPEAFGSEHHQLFKQLPGLCVLGGCCGTDHRHVEAIRAACLSERDSSEWDVMALAGC